MTPVEGMRIRLVVTASILLHLFVSFFVVMSVIEVCQTAALIIRQIQNQHNVIIIGALVTAFIPFACILFWAGKAIVTQIHRVFYYPPLLDEQAPAQQQGLIQQGRNKD